MFIMDQLRVRGVLKGKKKKKNLLYKMQWVRRRALSAFAQNVLPATARPGLPSRPPNQGLWVTKAPKGQIIIGRESKAWAP
jgi:hypothetical protein